jgi:hypothetical protein
MQITRSTTAIFWLYFGALALASSQYPTLAFQLGKKMNFADGRMTDLVLPICSALGGAGPTAIARSSLALRSSVTPWS